MPEPTYGFGPELRRRRLAAGLTLDRLAALVHYSKSHLSKVETGQKSPTPELARWCDTALGAGGTLAALVPERAAPARRSPASHDGEVLAAYGLVRRALERNKRRYLSDDVLKDPGSAVVWWLARNDEQVEGTVERIGLLARLSAAANNSEVAPPFRDLLYAPEAEPEPGPEHEPEYEPEPEGGVPPEEYVAEQLMSWLGFNSDDPEMVHLAARMAEDVRATGRKDEAEKFLRFFGFPGDPPPFADGQPPDEEGPFADAG